MGFNCWFHRAEEIATEFSYRICGECGHVWQSEKAYLDDVCDVYFEHGWLLFLTEEVQDNQTCCPLCSHDW